MHETSDFRKGLHILIDNDPYTIVDFQHVKPGKGNQFKRTKVGITPWQIRRYRNL